MSWGFTPSLPAAEQQSGYAPLSADVGTFALTGQAISLSMPCEAGIFTLDGQAIGNLPLIAETGNFNVTGFAPGIPPLDAEVGEFALAGQALGFPTYQLTAEHGKFYADGRSINQPIVAASTVKIVTLGDSITEFSNNFKFGDITSVNNRSNGEIHWVRQRGKAGFKFEVWSDATARWIHNGTAWASAPLFNGANQGRAGDWAKGVERRTTAVINMGPDIVVLAIGTNIGPVEDGQSVAATTANIDTVVNRLVAAGIKVIIGTVRPRAVSTSGSSGTFSIEITPARYAQLQEISAHIRTLDNDSTIFVWDSEPDLLDPNPTAPLITGSCYRWAVRDGVHLTPRGAWAGSRTLELTLDRVLGDGTWFNADASVSNAIANGVLSGSGGTVNAGITGTAPNSHTITKVGSATLTAVSSVSSGWIVAVSSPGGQVISNNYNAFRLDSADIDPAAQGWTSATWVKAFAEIEVTGGEIIGNTQLGFFHGTTVRSYGLGSAASNRAEQAYPTESRIGWVETAPQQIGAATAVKAALEIDVRTDIAGSATVKLKRWIIRAVNDPRVDFPYDPMDPQIYGLTGQEALFDLDGSTPSLTADAGVFIVSGQDVETDAARRLSCDAGKFAALGNGGVPLYDEQGNYLYDELGRILYTEIDPAEFIIFTSLLLTGDVGLFTLAGQDAGLIEQSPGLYSFAAEAGVFPLAGQDANLAASLIPAMQLGEHAITGQDVDFILSKASLAAEAGIFATFGQVVSLRRDLFPEAGIFTVSGEIDFTVARRRVYIQFGPSRRVPGKIYPVATIPLNGTFYDEAGDAFDPMTVELFIISPSGRESSYTHGVDSELRRTADGRYTFDATLDEPGRWHYQWRVIAHDVVSVKESDILVQDTPFYSGSRRAYA